MNNNDIYGKELIIDLHECDVSQFNRTDITRYFEELCELIDMERCGLHFCDDVGVPDEEKQTNPKTKGTSAIQFIITSGVSIHALDILKQMYVNIFSCKDFNVVKASDFTRDFFKGKLVQSYTVKRL